MNGYAKRAAHKRKAIIDGAQRLFFRQGVKETRIADIAKEAQVSQVTIYNYFESKENLLRVVFENFMEEIQTVAINRLFYFGLLGK